MRQLWMAAGLVTVMVSSVQAQNVDPASDLGQFRSLRGDGMAALDKGDAATALDDFSKAQAILPDSPSIALLKAQVFLQQKRKTEAKAALTDYLKRGNVLDLSTNTDFNAIWDGDLDNQLQANTQSIGTAEPAGTLPGFTLAEALAYASDNQQVFLSGIHTGKVMALAPEGAREVITFRPGVAAYGLGFRDGTLWAATAQSRQTESFEGAKPVTSKIVAINPADGSIISAVSDSKADRQFGHLALGRDDLYVADTTHGEILRLPGYGKALEVLIPEGYMDSPQGLAENSNASALMISDFISGLYRVDLSTGGMARLLPPADGNLLGISSLSRYGDDLIAVQTGFKPNRILRLHMSADWNQVERVEVLLRSDKFLSQPSQGVVADDRFVFVAKSQWSNLDDRGNAKSDDPEPAAVDVIKLTP